MSLWHINEDLFDPRKMNSKETVNTIGNGYFAIRETFEENYFGVRPTTLLYGVFDDTGRGKKALANVPNWLPIKRMPQGSQHRAVGTS